MYPPRKWSWKRSFGIWIAGTALVGAFAYGIVHESDNSTCDRLDRALSTCTQH